MAVDREVKSGVSPGPHGGVPYGDMAEVTGPPVIDLVIDTYREFLATDARSILCVLYPHHYNFILNPAMRTSTTGWAVTGSNLHSPTPDLLVPVTTDAVANSALVASTRTNNPDGQIVMFQETIDKPMLAQATARWDAAQAASDRLYDVTGNGKDAIFGAAAAAPVPLAYTGSYYLAIPTGTASTNYLSGVAVSVPGTASMIWDIGTTTSLGSGFDLISQTTTVNGALSVRITSAGAFEVNTWVAGAIKTLTWAGAVTVSTRKRYRVELTTTGAELFIDDVSQTLKTFGATRVPVANSTQNLLLTAGAATPTFYNIYSFNLYEALVMSPANNVNNVSQITNTGSAGGLWTINRAATGLKLTVVDRPLVLFGGAQYMNATLTQQGTGTVVLAVREYADTALNILASGSGTEPPTTGGFRATVSASSLNQAIDMYGTGGATVNSTKAMANHGQHVIATALNVAAGTTLFHWVDGVLAVSKAGPTSGILIKDRLRVGAGAGMSSFSFIGAALFDRVLTDAEVAQAGQELLGTVATNPTVEEHSYILQTGSTIAKASVPFPVTAAMTGYTDWTALASLDEESWVGRSFYLSGTGTIRFKDPAGPYVYVGPTSDVLEMEWYEPGRGSAQWTYSAYVMGPCKVRLLMDAYAPLDYTKAKSQPRYINLPTVADASAAAYDAAKPAIINQPDGNVWTLKAPPFYRNIGVLPVVPTPSTYVPPVENPDTYIQDGSKHVWKMITPRPTTAPYYADQGLYVDKNGYGATPWKPYEYPPTEKYVRYIGETPVAPNPPDILDQTVWEVNSSATLVAYSYYEDTGSGPTLGSEWTEWITVPASNEWQRIVLRTAVRTGHDDNSFLGCFWIDARLEFEDAEGARFSAFMLDPTEYPEAQYFDGSMSESALQDDFLWATSKPEDVNNSVSEYYYDRLVRVRFLANHLKYQVPVGRPIQFFFGSFDDPYTIPATQQTLMKPLTT